jgi:hypothetical protein
MNLLPIKILLFIAGIIWLQTLPAQIVSGKLYDIKDSSAVEFASIVCVNASEKFLTQVHSDQKGEFQINLPLETYYLKISKFVEYSEIRIINITHSLDTLNIGSIPIIKTPEYIQVQFKDISRRKERKNQESLLKEYNRKINKYPDIGVSRPNGKFKMIRKAEIKNNESRLNLFYQINFNDLIKKKN